MLCFINKEPLENEIELEFEEKIKESKKITSQFLKSFLDIKNNIINTIKEKRENKIISTGIITNKFNYLYNDLNSIFEISYFNLSNIILSKDDIHLFILWFFNKEKINEAKMIYKLTKDGANSFINKISYKGQIVILFKTENKRRFGIYLKENLYDSEDIYFKDKGAFIFSFDTKNIYPVCNPEKAFRWSNIRTYIGLGNTGNLDGISINLSNDNFKTDDLVYCNGENELKNEIYYGFSKKYELTGESDFIIKEVEVFQINLAK